MNAHPPLVSIITPSLDQGRFLPATLRSVASQTYPRMEHVIVDGGSTDGSVAIIRAHAATFPGKVIWVSEPDKGQTDAINKGLRIASGSILAYLNSDDTYEPGTVAAAAGFLQEHPDIALVHGRGFHVDSGGRRLDEYPSKPCDHSSLAEYCHICQPTAFWRREVLDAIGPFDGSLRFCMDYDYWIRASRRFPMGYLDRHLANTRLHEAAKTVSQRFAAHREIVRTLKRHYDAVSDHWIYAYANSFPWIHRLRSGSVPRSLVYVAAFTLLAGGLFLKYNRRIPLRSLGHFFRSLPRFHNPALSPHLTQPRQPTPAPPPKP